MGRALSPWVGAFLLSACLWDGNGAGGNPPRSEAGMALIPAAGKDFRQGARGASAPADELPSFQSGFNYDFYLDTVEVTQGDYADLMGAAPAETGTGAGPDYPVYGISWFEAALFANARSKAAGRDTIYVYESIARSEGGGVYDLRGLQIHLERLGFRLPTEAEWEYAAGAGRSYLYPWGDSDDSAAAARFAWYAANSEGRVHPVGRLAANGFGLHDMAGNVMEWVNDWKGRYPAGQATDFAGSRDPGPQGETPVKGGAFRYGLSALRLSNRSATYATIRSAKAEYVGFRCALGAIPKPAFSFADGGRADTDPVRLDLTRLGALVEGRRAKLVFVNAGADARHLAYVDYGRQPVRVKEFGDVSNVFHPSISPDGNWVAYGTATEGAVTGSEIQVRSLDSDTGSPRILGPGFIPRWWVDPASRDTFLLYSSSGIDDMQPAWTGERTLLRKMSQGRPAGEEYALAGGAFHDGRSQDGRWLATGFRRLKVRDGTSGGISTLFTAPENGKQEGDTSQVCNVSIAPDSTGRLLFLDFGYDGKSALTGSWYDIHAIAFLANPEGRVLGWYPAPRGEKAWDDLEWSNAPRYAVAAATDPAGRHGNLYLLDIEDSLSTRLAAGAYLTTPALWLGASSGIHDTGLAADSLGHYNEPPTDDYQGAFSAKMARFWARHNRLELIFTGSSHVYTGIDPRAIHGLETLDAAYPACGWLGQEAWVRGYALPHCPRLKVLVMEAFPGWMHYPDGDFTWAGQISQTLGIRYDASHDFWKDGLPLGFEAMAAQAPVGATALIDSLGTAPLASAGWGDVVLPTDSEWDFGDPACQGVLGRMEALARDVSARGIHLLYVVHPMHPGFRDTPYYGPYGPRLEVARRILDSLKAMEKVSPYVHFYDAHNYGDHDYGDADASNAGHLGSAGAAKLTARIDSLVHQFQK